VVGEAWIARVDRAMARPLYPYQRLGAAWIAERLALGKGSLLGDDPGTGKTSQTIAALVAANAFPAIVVCPTILKSNWRTEIEYASVSLETQVLQGGKGYVYPAHVYILNYELLRTREKQLLDIAPKVIVFDECHLLKEAKVKATHRSAAATRLAHQIRLSILLTGTPILNKPAEYWKLFHLIDPKGWSDYEDFLDRYCRALTDAEKETGVDRIASSHASAKRVVELQSRAEAVMLRRTKEEVMPDLPPKTRRSVLVDLEPEDRESYDLCKASVLRWCAERGQKAPRQRQLEALAQISKLRQIAALGKLKKAAREYLDGWFAEARRPLVVFAYHRAVTAGLEEIGHELGIATTRIRTEGVSESDRAASIAAFQKGQADMIVVPIKAAGLGLNLQRASDALFLERMWVPAELIQAEDRLHRIGQRDSVVITYLDAANTVDEHMAKVLDGKHTLMRRLVDGDSAGGEVSMIHHVLGFLEEFV
jgi:SNF2 family DNA or RNA helicase